MIPDSILIILHDYFDTFLKYEQLICYLLELQFFRENIFATISVISTSLGRLYIQLNLVMSTSLSINAWNLASEAFDRTSSHNESKLFTII